MTEWVTIDYRHPSSNAHAVYTKRTCNLRPRERTLPQRAATETEITNCLKQENAQQEIKSDWRNHPDVLWIRERLNA